MSWKILITLAVIVGAALTIRNRLNATAATAAGRPAEPPLVPPGTFRRIAAGLLGVMLLGSGWYLFSEWRTGHEVVSIQVVNANTGTITPYEARRRDIEGRVFRTLDGRRVRLADVERMIVLGPSQRL